MLAIIAVLGERVGECSFGARATSDVAAQLAVRGSVNRDHPAAVIVPSYNDCREFVFEGNCLTIDHAFGSREAASTAWIASSIKQAARLASRRTSMSRSFERASSAASACASSVSVKIGRASCRERVCQYV